MFITGYQHCYYQQVSNEHIIHSTLVPIQLRVRSSSPDDSEFYVTTPIIALGPEPAFFAKANTSPGFSPLRVSNREFTQGLTCALSVGSKIRTVAGLRVVSSCLDYSDFELTERDRPAEESSHQNLTDQYEYLVSLSKYKASF